MFLKISKTAFPPEKPEFIWDGECGFCAYWVSRWEAKTKARIIFKPYQETYLLYPDIPLIEFKKASRLIETDGRVFSGPNSAFRVFMFYKNKNDAWHRFYVKYKWFRKLCDRLYDFISRNRGFMLRLTKICFGNDPKNLRPYWAIYLTGLIFGLCLFSVFL